MGGVALPWRGKDGPLSAAASGVVHWPGMCTGGTGQVIMRNTINEGCHGRENPDLVTSRSGSENGISYLARYPSIPLRCTEGYLPSYRGRPGRQAKRARCTRSVASCTDFGI
jgi:hypothetical protein